MLRGWTKWIVWPSTKRWSSSASRSPRRTLCHGHKTTQNHVGWRRFRFWFGRKKTLRMFGFFKGAQKEIRSERESKSKAWNVELFSLEVWRCLESLEKGWLDCQTSLAWDWPALSDWAVLKQSANLWVNSFPGAILNQTTELDESPVPLCQGFRSEQDTFSAS